LELKHEHIVRTDTIIRKEEGSYYIMEKADCDLFGYFDSGVKITEEEFGYLMLDIVEGMKYLHANNVVHLDLKPDNILVFKKQERVLCKIADFGHSIRLKETEQVRKKFRSTEGYMAPEVMNNKRISKAADVYSFGVLMCELARKIQPTQKMVFYFNIAQTCCSSAPNLRYTFEQLERVLQTTISSISRMTSIPLPQTGIEKDCAELIRSHQGTPPVT